MDTSVDSMGSNILHKNTLTWSRVAGSCTTDHPIGRRLLSLFCYSHQYLYKITKIPDEVVSHFIGCRLFWKVASYNGQWDVYSLHHSANSFSCYWCNIEYIGDRAERLIAFEIKSRCEKIRFSKWLSTRKGPKKKKNDHTKMAWSTSMTAADTKETLMSKRSDTSVVWNYFGFKKEDAAQRQVLWKHVLLLLLPREATWETCFNI